MSASEPGRVRRIARTDGRDIDWHARAAELAPVVAAASDRTEAARQVPDDVMAALHGAALFRMALPESVGGAEATPLALIDMLGTIAAADASTAWCLGQGAGCALTAGYLDPESAAEVFGAPDAVLAWGSQNADGRAVRVDGGYRVTGAWRFASGSRHAAWLGAHCRIVAPDLSPIPGDGIGGGGQEVRTLLFPKAEAVVTDDWNVVGLRGTGSDSYAVDDVFVPERLSFVRESPDFRREAGPLFRLTMVQIYAMGIGATALGIARAMLDSFEALAEAKTGGGMSTILRENAHVQTEVARNEARLRAARAFLTETVGRLWQTICAGDALSFEDRAIFRIATTHAANEARDIATYAWQAAGTNAIFVGGEYERRFRDINTLTQQVQAHISNLEHAGRVFLGLPPGNRV